MSPPVRLRRLMADYTRVAAVFKEHPKIAIKKVYGNPPEKYEVEYRVKCLVSRAGKVEPKDLHVAEIFLPLGYPRQAPVCRMLTPVFHPNIAPHAVCIGDHWAAGESLVHLMIRIAEMLAYQSYNIKSPLNGEAARWADQHKAELPTDSGDFTPAIRPEDVVVDGTSASKTLPVAKAIPVARAVPVAQAIPVARIAPQAAQTPAVTPPSTASHQTAVGERARGNCSQCNRSVILPIDSAGEPPPRCMYCGGEVSPVPGNRPPHES